MGVVTHLLVDGNGLACKLWWASTSDVPARFTLAIGGVQVVHNVGMTTVCWDTPGGSWRREVMPAYKAKRPPKPQALVEALNDCQRTAFSHVVAPGFEADDLLATFALAEAAGGHEALILAEDKDFAQLVGPRCRMVNARGELTTEADVERRWGVPPDRMRHLLSWMGDSSDGLPGVPRIGAKKAIPHALAGEIGDQMTWELVGLATVPVSAMVRL